MNLKILTKKVNKALDLLYKNDIYLFEHDLCERCISHKFANYLELQNFENYYIDCEYNRAYSKRNGGTRTKKITTKDGNYVDIVITKRNDNVDDDLVCFEVKKWNNSEGEIGFKIDRLKLKILTGKKLPTDIKSGDVLKDEDGENYCFNYKYGFFIIFGLTRDEVKIEYFK
ncbi:MAG: hypothetical protein PHT51_01765 [Patescibacteria group bacterium]|nr:hypothetical protein [Patescibacteria group bacterium]MDD4610376.1 hypothetical protein [Patescibacteria group bacterium]